MNARQTTTEPICNLQSAICKPGEAFSVGVARVDVTPPLTIPHLAIAPRHGFFKGVHDPLFAKAIVVGDGERRVALVTVDSIGIARRVAGLERDFIAEVRWCAHEQCGIGPEDIMLCATHAHSTPDLGGFRSLAQHPGAMAWLDALRDQLASVIAMADRATGPARLKVGRGTVAGLGAGRRLRGTDGRLYYWRDRPPNDEIADWGISDDEVVVLSFEPARVRRLPRRGRGVDRASDRLRGSDVHPGRVRCDCARTADNRLRRRGPVRADARRRSHQTSRPDECA
ncbi:MAG: hypothetical protein GW867_06620 [Armatimonadetes bacterium]|nr:hypothetical protein [Armatimonadota bacterium]